MQPGENVPSVKFITDLVAEVGMWARCHTHHLGVHGEMHSSGNRESHHSKTKRYLSGHTPVGIAEKKPLVAPLPVAAVAPSSSGGGVPEVNLDPTLGTPMLQEIVIKEWKEVGMGELFETNGLSAVLHTFAEKECNSLLTVGKDCPTGTCPCPHPCGQRLNHAPMGARSYRQACYLGVIYRRIPQTGYCHRRHLLIEWRPSRATETVYAC